MYNSTGGKTATAGVKKPQYVQRKDQGEEPAELNFALNPAATVLAPWLCERSDDTRRSVGWAEMWRFFSPICSTCSQAETIHRMQTTELLIRKLPFQRLVREVDDPSSCLAPTGVCARRTNPLTRLLFGPCPHPLYPSASLLLQCRPSLALSSLIDRPRLQERIEIPGFGSPSLAGGVLFWSDCGGLQLTRGLVRRTLHC